MLETRGLSGGWGSTRVVEDVSLRVDRGETVAVIGRNGVGKSTLLELVVGRARRHGGTILLGGQEITAFATHERARRRLGYVPQGREVFPSLSVREHLQIAARPGKWTIQGVLEMFPRLGERLASKGNELSGGEQQMLAIARALLGNPTVLLMDEPFEGLAPIVVEQLVGTIGNVVRTSAIAVLMVEQRVDIALELSQRCLVLDRGRCVFEGSSQELACDEERIAQLMGLGEPFEAQ